MFSFRDENELGHYHSVSEHTECEKGPAGRKGGWIRAVEVNGSV